MVISKIIRNNKEFVKPVIELPRPLTSIEKVKNVLSDGKWHSRKGLTRDTKTPSQGSMHNTINTLLNNDEIISGTCPHCDGAQILYKLK
jgi:hypothetical protein